MSYVLHAIAAQHGQVTFKALPLEISDNGERNGRCLTATND